MDDDVETDQRLEHHRNPPEFVDLQNLFLITGVEYFKVSALDAWKCKIYHANKNILNPVQKICSLMRI